MHSGALGLHAQLAKILDGPKKALALQIGFFRARDLVRLAAGHGNSGFWFASPFVPMKGKAVRRAVTVAAADKGPTSETGIFQRLLGFNGSVDG